MESYKNSSLYFQDPEIVSSKHNLQWLGQSNLPHLSWKWMSEPFSPMPKCPYSVLTSDHSFWVGPCLEVSIIGQLFMLVTFLLSLFFRGQEQNEEWVPYAKGLRVQEQFLLHGLNVWLLIICTVDTEKPWTRSHYKGSPYPCMPMARVCGMRLYIRAQRL